MLSSITPSGGIHHLIQEEMKTTNNVQSIQMNSSNYPDVVEQCGSSSGRVIHCHFVKDRGKLFNGFMMNCTKDIYRNGGFFGCVGKLFEVLEGNTGLGNSLISSYERHIGMILKFWKFLVKHSREVQLPMKGLLNLCLGTVLKEGYTSC